MGSFSRKYAALSGMKIEELQKLFKFRPVTIGADLEINGGKFNFFYSFHMIPCIGFEVTFNKKKLFFSGDTYFDPQGLKNIYEGTKLFGAGRYQMLSNRDFFQYDLNWVG